MAKRQWVRAPAGLAKLTAEKNAALSRTCAELIEHELRPRLLARTPPSASDWGGLSNIHAKARNARFRFIAQYGYADGSTSDWPFARLDAWAVSAFNMMWFRHAEKWWPLHCGVTLKEALRLIVKDSVLHPH